jgi:hypothetical protein
LPKRFWDFSVSHYSIIAVLINISLVLVAVALHAALPNLIEVSIFGVILVGLALFDYRLKKLRELSLHEDFIVSLLEAAASSVLKATQPPLPHMRACLMVPDGEDLVIAYAHGFAPEDRDRNIRIKKGTGCCGQAWEQEQTMIADLTQTPGGGMPPQWGLRESERQKVRQSLRSIISVPVRAGRKFEIVGILNLDSDNFVADTKFIDKPIHDIVYSFVKVLSALLNEVID